MIMTNQQLQLVKRSWKLLREVDPAILGDVFYSRLFSQHPGLRSLFKGSMEQQYQKFIDMLSVIVARLDQPDKATQEINQLSRSHAGYGVKAEHYIAVREALLWTLEHGLENDWNDVVKQAWIECYDDLTQSMRPA
jgi:hemoglobin-like flavoprotein